MEAVNAITKPDSYALRIVGTPSYSWSATASASIGDPVAWGLAPSATAHSDQDVVFGGTVAAMGDGERDVGWLDHGDGSVSFAFAAPGDTNIDRLVDSLDAASFLATRLYDAGPYDGPAGEAGVAIVPEPGCWPMLLTVGALIAGRRSRHQPAASANRPAW